MRIRVIFCLVLGVILAGRASGQPASGPATQAATQPTLKLRATAAESNEIDLKWFDKANTYSRYFIYRSDDGGKTFHPIGHESGGANTGPVYQHADTTVAESTDYKYCLESLDNTVISDVAEAQTPARNLLEAASGKTTLQLTDVASVGFWRATLNAAAQWLMGFVPHLLVAVVIFLIFFGVYRFFRRLVLSSIHRANVDATVHELLLGLVKWGILGFGIVIGLDQIGVQITALLTGVSIMGLAVGLAAQDTLANLIASVVVYWDKPFKVGDWVTFDGNYGRVQRVTLRTTRILAQNGDLIVSPNTAVLGSKLINHSANPINWVSVPVGIPDSMPIELARTALLATVKGDDRLLTDPPAKVVVDSISPGAVNLFLCFCVKDESMQSDVLQEYLEKAKNALDQVPKKA